MLLVYKIRQEGKPKYFLDKFKKKTGYKTRFAEDGGIKKEKILQYSDSKNSFVPSSIEIWNNLPCDLRASEKLEVFKKNLKKWIRNNIKI